MSYFRRIRDELKELDEFDPREIQGCSESEVKILESLHPAKLPFSPSVQEFLYWGGKQMVYMRPATGFYANTIEKMLKVMEEQFLNKDNFHQVFLL